MSKAKPVSAKTKAGDSFGRLQHLNKWLAIIYAVQALVIIVAAGNKTFGLTASFLDAGRLASQPLFSLSLGQVLALSLGISAAFHALLSSMARSAYEEQLAKAENPYRWLENAFSTSLLSLAIGLTAGMRDIASISMLLALGFAAHLLGWQFEHHIAAKQPQDARRSFVLLVVTGLAVWAAVGVYVAVSILFGGGVSPWLGLAYGVAVVCTLGMGWIMLRYEQQLTRWRDYGRNEQVFVLLSFAVKTLVAWLLYAAVA